MITSSTVVVTTPAMTKSQLIDALQSVSDDYIISIAVPHKQSIVDGKVFLYEFYDLEGVEIINSNEEGAVNEVALKVKTYSRGD